MSFVRFVPRVALLASAALVLAACGGSDSKEGAASPASSGSAAARQGTQAPTQPFGPVVAASELVVGDNRFPLGIIDQKTGQPVPDAQVHFRFFTVQGNQGTLKSEADAKFVAPARDAGVTGIVEHKHPDGTIHPHANVEADVGVYVAPVTFDQAGDWGVEATFKTPDGRDGRVTAPFKVLAKSVTPAVGEPAPRSRNLTAKDVSDLTQIDSSANPVPALHQESIADAIAAHKPALVMFSTPGYCTTRFCGPSYELVNKLLPAYGDKAALIHVEVYKDPVAKVTSDTVNEWKLQSEPYFFVIDRNGIITAKFEGPTGLSELDAALKKVTG